MHKKTTRIILAGITAFLLVLTVTGAASAISLEIDLPTYALAGETVTGYVWIKDAGDTENKLSAYTVTLVADPALIDPHIDYSATYLDLSSKTSGGFDTKNPLFIAEAYGGASYAISPVSEKLCTFNITIPSDAVPDTSYTVGFNSTPQKTFMTTYTTYYDDGILGHGSDHGTLAKAALTRSGDTITVVLPATYHNVTFYKEAGSVHTKSTVLNGSLVSAPANPEKEGYTFNGWNVSSPSGPVYVFSTPVTADLDLYANWSVNSYNIAYIQPSTGGTISGASTADYGSPISVTPTPNSGYEFVKLIVTKAGSSTTVSSSGKTFVMPAFDVNVTAQFKVSPTPVPTSRPSSGGDNKGASQIMPSQNAGGQNSVDVTAQYAGMNFICLGTSAADIAAIRAIDPILAAALEAKIARAEAAGIRLTNNKGAPAIVSSDVENPVLDHVTFSKVYDITSTEPNVKLTQVTVTVPKADVAASGLTTNDVTIYHNMVTYDIWVPLDTLQITEDAVNYYYTVATDGTSPFGVLIKRFDDSPAVPTTKPTTRPTQSSPVPILGIVAGLAVVAVLLRLRKE